MEHRHDTDSSHIHDQVEQLFERLAPEQALDEFTVTPVAEADHRAQDVRADKDEEHAPEVFLLVRGQGLRSSL